MPKPSPITNAQLTEYLAFANDLADAAAAETLPLFRAGSAITNKDTTGGFDPVTAADEGAEQAIRDLIAARYPDHGVQGEEGGHTAGASGLTWVIDPIDGTRAFISGIPLWTTLIALNDGARPVLGVIDQPYLGERFVGSAKGARMRARAAHSASGTQDHALSTRKTMRLADAIFSSTSPELFATVGDKRVHDALVARARLTRYGCDAYAYAMLAAGLIDLVVEPGLRTWDVQALIPVIEAAGGVIGRWDGGPAAEGGNIIAAATPELFAEVKTLISA